MAELKNERWNYYELILTPLFFIAYFLYIWLRIDPSLYYQSQEPVFFLMYQFFQEHLLYPGGLSDYSAAFLSQFYYFSWAGALMLTILAALTTFLTRWLLQIIGMKTRENFLVFIPALIILASHSHYEFLLANTIGFFLSLLFTVLYIRFAPNHPIARFLIYICLALALYFIAGAAFFLFTLLCCVYELLFSRHTILGLLTVLSVAGLPYLAKSTVFFISTNRAYLYLSPYNLVLKKIHWLFFLLYGFYILVFLGQSVINDITSKKKTVKNRNLWSFLKIRPGSWLNSTLQTAAVVILFAGTVLLSYNKIQKKQLLVDQFARLKQWRHVLEEVKHASRLDWKMVFQANRAMFHLGRLSSDMFSLPQLWGDHGLVIVKDAGFAYPLLNSNFYYELGLFNESEHWAHESMSLRGETGWTLERLAMVNIVKGEFDAAHMFISKLNRSLLFRKNAGQLRELLNNKSRLSRNPGVIAARSRMPDPEHDFIYYTESPMISLERIYNNNPKNIMAYEYLMASYMLNGELYAFVKEVNRLRDLGYKTIPRHYQEALVLYFTSTKRDLPPIYKNEVDKFKKYQSILNKYNKNQKLAYNELHQYFGNTYWFYLMYFKPKEQ